MILATVVVLVLIALMAEGAYVGYELDENAQDGCCCGAAAKAGGHYAAPPSRRCAAGHTHVAGPCSSWNCGNREQGGRATHPRDSGAIRGLRR